MVMYNRGRPQFQDSLATVSVKNTPMCLMVSREEVIVRSTSPQARGLENDFATNDIALTETQI